MNFVCKIDRDPYKGLYLQFNLLLSATANAKIEIYKIDDEEKIIYNSIDFIKPVNNEILLNNIIYLNESYLSGIDTTFKAKVIYENGNSEEKTASAVNYQLSLGEVNTKYEEAEGKYYSYFDVFVDNFSQSQIKDLHIEANLESDPTNKLAANYRTINPMLNRLNVIDKLDVTSLIKNNNNVVEHLEYKLVGKINDTKIETNVYKFDIVKENTAPEISLKNIDLKSYGNTFQLFFDAFIRDSELDDVHFNIYDNHGNILFQQDYYTYVPKIEHIEYLYQIKHFSSLFLQLRAEISDNKTFTKKETFEIPLFEVTNLRLTRDILYWELTNFSSSVLKTQVEILDINDNIVYKGKTQSNRLELKRVTITDGQVIELLRTNDIKYYKFRIRVSCEEENYVGYYEFDSGTLTSTKWHNAPIVKINDIQFSRSIENEKRVKINFSIKDPITERYFEDLITYKIFDDSGNVIYNTYSLFSLPEKRSNEIEVNVPYNFTDKPETTITVEVVSEYNKKGSDSLTQNAYYIKAAPIKNQQALEFEMDNYYTGDLTLQLIGYVKLPLDKDGKQYYEEVISEMTIPNTINRMKSSIRFIPKVYNNDRSVLLYRLAVKCDQFPNLNIENGKFIYETVYKSLISNNKTDQVEIRAINDQKEDEAEEYYTFPSMKNRTPSIIVDYYNTEFNGSKSELDVYLNLSIEDLDKDKIKYMISDKYGCIKKSDGFIETYPTDGKIRINASKKYKLANLDTSFIQVYVEAEDEDGAYDEIPFKIPLHVLNCINFSSDTNADGETTGGHITWNYRLYSKKAIRMVIEILDNEGYLYGKSKVIDGLYSTEMKTVSQFINFEDYNEGNYRFRIKTYSEGETWSMFYPNSIGYEFSITDKGEVVPITAITPETDENPYSPPSNDLTVNDTLEGVVSLSSKKVNKLNANANIKTILANPYSSKVVSPDDFNSVGALNNYGHPQSFNTLNYNGINLHSNENDKRLPIQKYNYRLFKDGKKVLEHHYRKQDHYDNYNILYLEKTEKNGSQIEIETWGNLLMDAEQFSSKDKESFVIKDETDIFNFYHGQVTTKDFYYDPALTNVIIIRNGMRINPKLFNVKDSIDKKHLTITICDRLYVGDTIYLTSDKLFSRTVINEKVSTKTNGDEVYTKPLYYVPFSYAMVDDNIITDIKTEHAEIFINGYCAIPEVDYIITDPHGGNLNIPSLIVFRDLLLMDSEVEIIYRGTDVDKPYATKTNNMRIVVSNSGGYSRTITGSISMSGFHTLAKDNFSLFIDRLKIPNTAITVSGTTLSVNYKKPITKAEYDKVGNLNITKECVIYVRSNISNNVLMKTNSTNTVPKPSINLKVNSSEDNLEFALAVYDLGKDELLNFFKQENLGILNCNNKDLSFTEKTFAVKDIKLPGIFNRNIDIMAMGSVDLFDNATLLNPSRILQFSDNNIDVLDCNDSGENGLFDINLNENIDYADLDCVTSDIIISVKNR